MTCLGLILHYSYFQLCNEYNMVIYVLILREPSQNLSHFIFLFILILKLFCIFVSYIKLTNMQWIFTFYVAIWVSSETSECELDGSQIVFIILLIILIICNNYLGYNIYSQWSATHFNHLLKNQIIHYMSHSMISLDYSHSLLSNECNMVIYTLIKHDLF